MAMQAVTPTMPTMSPLFTTGPASAADLKTFPAPLFTTGPYALYPLHVCSEEAVATLFVKICARGNPILQEKPAADLYHLGVAFYRKSVGSAISTVFLKGVEPVALMFGWDVFHGGVWKGTSGPPESLVCHAAIGAAIFASKPHATTMPGQDMFMAFTGVALPHPGLVLMHAMKIMSAFSASAAGYTNFFGYAVHAKTIEEAQALPDEPGVRRSWNVSYRDIEVSDQAVREEMCSIHPGTAVCECTSVAFTFETIRQDKRAHVQEFAEALRPGVARLLASSQIQFHDGVQMPMACL
jgi:hypothetical protein